MGYQPALDGLRAVSVIAVILYHAGFSWMRGGFFGVEVFFVVSGFLITSLLIDEREWSERTNLGQFWLRRARRLLPALAMVLAFVGVAAAVFGTDEQQSQLRADFPWAILYSSNWGQIVGGVPYYAGNPPLLRHLWSLAVEEQWYLIWPLAFVALTRLRIANTARAQLLGSSTLFMMFWAFLLHQSGPGPIRSSIGWFDGADRVNFMYLSTFTRSSGLILGAAAAFVWRPWRSASTLNPAHARRTGRPLDLAGGVAVGGLAVIASVAVLTEGYVYQWLLALVSLLSLMAVLVAVHPAAGGFRAVFSWRPLVETGKRSYGLYLWHWPIFVLMGAPHGSVVRVLGAALTTVVLAELSYRYVETPVRRGALGRWWQTQPASSRLTPILGMGAIVVGLTGYYANVEPFDRAAGGADVTFAETAAVAPTVVDAVAPTTVVTPVGPSLPRHVVVVGDSQAHALAINQPDGIEETFDISDGALDGCSVYSGGSVLSQRANFNNNFSICDDWADKWARSARRADADIALVVLGAWDVFDLVEPDGEELSFGSRAWDVYVSGNLQSGIDALVAEGVHVALLEVPCMRPQDVQGAGVPALPERGDDDRVDHVNDLWRQVASANPDTVSFVDGPDEWCNDETVATDLAYRWDGVHVYTPGANLVYESIAPALLDM